MVAFKWDDVAVRCDRGSSGGTDQLVTVFLETEPQQSQEGSQSELHTTQTQQSHRSQLQINSWDESRSSFEEHHSSPAAGNTVGWRHDLQSLPICSRTRWGSRPWWLCRRPAPPAAWTDRACSVWASEPGGPSAWSLQVTSSSSRQAFLNNN